MRFTSAILALVVSGPMVAMAAPTAFTESRRDLHAGTAETVGPEPETMRRGIQKLNAGTAETVGPEPETMRHGTQGLHAGTAETVGPEPESINELPVRRN
ncbi:uncharacterized protein GIQ15_03713 [Arthroderma uncinatum]|uniref:uncharacterized protein n=1 Tax=Arthroderma uncinatum TaxID=74035 RepID=UPI00144AE028|nr:uncharacterized protein GIQ15_03713 [Arthroderma uncinatum]KAF3484389.1 hypothetical protein GIQ15_03713 [Arthroderma uncinatum]